MFQTDWNINEHITMRLTAVDPVLGSHCSDEAAPYDAFSTAQSALRRDVHGIHAPNAAEAGAATGFVVATLVTMALDGPILWIFEDACRAKIGRPSAQGLADLGLPAQNILFASARSAQQAMWAAEQGAGNQSVATVVCDLASPQGFGLVASRRLALRSRQSGVPIFVSTIGDCPSTAARTRWIVRGAKGTGVAPGLLGFPAFDVNLVKNRQGPCGRFALSFRPHERRFVVENACTGTPGRFSLESQARTHDVMGPERRANVVTLESLRRRIEKFDPR